MCIHTMIFCILYRPCRATIYKLASIVWERVAIKIQISSRILGGELGNDSKDLLHRVCWC